MGRIGTVVDAVKQDGLDEVRVDLDDGDVATCDHFAPAGVDSLPLPGDSAATEETAGNGARQVAGYADATNDGKALPGEFRIYARAPDGTLVSEIWLKGDGSGLLMEIVQANAPVRIKADSVIVDSPDFNAGGAGGRPIARVGDLVAISIPPLASATGGIVFPASMSPPMAAPIIAAAGQIISGCIRAKASDSGT